MASSTVGSVADAVAVERLPEVVGALRRADAPDGHESERARALAGLLRHPAIEVETQTIVRGRPNVIARVRGTGEGPGLLLDGHFNAGFHPGPWSGDPREPWVADGRLFGGAVVDMLGGLAAMALALRAVADHGPPPGDVVLLAGMHEDTIGLGTKAALASRDGWPGFGICGDPTDLQVVTAHGGCVKFELELTGHAVHVTRREDGADALAAAAAVVQALPGTTWSQADPAAHPRLDALPCVVVGELHAGIGPGVVAPSAVVRGDVRTLPGMTPAGVLADVERRVAEVVPAGIGCQVRSLFDQRPLVDVGVAPLADALVAASREIRGREPVVGAPLPGQRYCTEAADMAAFGIPSVVFGPGDWRFEPDESVALDDLAAAARIYAATAVGLRGDQKPSRNTSL
ncbi:M20 family metallopeptidase [Patulibacter defluvii]|uniref:M20 family metallopeptidase n=1 Tax=Patulibacter defluvii TaxID=3095358 RepID=UPI002A75A7A6|nr:M20/M25/M40 family metallo-hydrolase [Patulibacter sp. DM4]